MKQNNAIMVLGALLVLALAIFTIYKLTMPALPVITLGAVTTSRTQESVPVKAAAPTNAPQPKPKSPVVVMRETRKEGSCFEGRMICRLGGQIRNSQKLGLVGYLIGGVNNLTDWRTVSVFAYTADVVQNNGETQTETWKVTQADAARLTAKPELRGLSYKIGPETMGLIGAACTYLSGQPAVGAKSAGAFGMLLLEGSGKDWSPYANIFGVDEKLLEGQVKYLGYLAKRLNSWLGQDATVTWKNGKALWSYTSAPEDMREYFNTIVNMVDFTLPAPELAEGGKFPVNDLWLRSLTPPHLEDLPDYSISLVFVRVADESMRGRKYCRLVGSGKGNIKTTDGTFVTDFDCKSADMWIDITADDNRFLHKLSIKAPLDGKLMNTDDFKSVEWAGKLQLELNYEVNLR